MKQDNSNSTKGKSREEILESILEETARNPYKPRSSQRQRSSAESRPKPEPISGTAPSKPVKPPAESPQKPVPKPKPEPKPAHKPWPAPELKPEPGPAESSREAADSADHTQIFKKPAVTDAPADQTESDMTRIISRSDISETAFEKSKSFEPETAEEKIKKIQKEKAAAAKAAIQQKTEIENARYAQYEANKQAMSMLDDEDEKVNIYDPDEDDHEEGTGKNSIITEALNLFAFCVTVLFIFYMIFTQIFGFAKVNGDSMLPTLTNGDELFIQHILYTPQRGDLVVIDDQKAALVDKDGKVTEKDGLKCMMVKRIIAVGGDTIDFNFDKGEVRVNGEVLKEDYLKGQLTTRDEKAFTYPLTIPDGYVFVLGDNRSRSKDSRHADVGLVPEKDVTGKVLMRVYPFGGFGTVD